MIILLTLLISIYTVSVEGSCPAGFEHHGDACYRFVRQEMSWTKAKNYCHVTYGAHLVTVESAEENKYLKDYVNKHGKTLFGYDMWLGATDSNADKTWRWEVTDNSLLSYTDWLPGQPDGSFGGWERCLEFEVDYNLRWNDDECEERNFFICERPFNPPVPPFPAGR